MEELQYLGKLEYLKIEKVDSNSYNVMKRNFPFGFQKVATITVIPDRPCKLTPIISLSSNDIKYIKSEANKQFGLEFELKVYPTTQRNIYNIKSGSKILATIEDPVPGIEYTLNPKVDISAEDIDDCSRAACKFLGITGPTKKITEKGY